jgi:AraC-like DNA-binding protein
MLLYSIGQTESDMHLLQPFTIQDTSVKKMFSKDELAETEIPEILEKIIKENNNREFGYEFAIKSLFEQLSVILVRYWKNHSELNRLVGISSVTLERCRSVLPILWDQYQNPPSAAEMAARCYMSYSGFANVFRQLTGYSYLGYVHFIRIIKAKELLLTTKMSVTEIGQAIGFSTSSYFIEQFTKTQKVSPGQYRKQSKKFEI